MGTLALVTVLSVMRGFSGELERKMMGFNAHIQIVKKDSSNTYDIKAEENILSGKLRSISPFVEGEAIAQTKSIEQVEAAGVKVKGISPSFLEDLRDVEFYFPSKKLPSPEGKNIILGGELLSQLSVYPDFDDIVELVAPLAEVGPTGELEPRLASFELAGSFNSGIYEHDSKVVFISLEEARGLLGVQATEGWQIMLKDPFEAPRLAKILSSKLGDDFRINSWDDQNKKLFAALKLERIAMGAILSLMILIASFSIAGLVMMVVYGKRKDIAILRSVGLSAKNVQKVFLCYGLWIGLVGSIIGAFLGSLLCLLLNIRPIHLPSAYYLSILPVEWSLGWTSLFVFIGIVVSVAASLYPVRQATAEDPVLSLRYE